MREMEWDGGKGKRKGGEGMERGKGWEEKVGGKEIGREGERKGFADQCQSASYAPALPVESAPFFIPSTSFYSLSSWFTSSCTHHLITVTTFALTISHSLARPFTPDLKLICLAHKAPKSSLITPIHAGVLWSGWPCVGLVSVISAWAVPVCPTWHS